MTAPRAARMLQPRTIAIIGASEGEGALSANLVRHLTEHGFTGDIFLVNPRRDRIGEQPCYHSVTDVPVPVDVAALVVPADAVADALAGCVAAKVGAAVIMAAGFVEDSRGRGQERQAEIEAVLRGSDLVVCGPNSEGYFNISSGIALSFSSSVSEEFLRYSASWMAEGDTDLTAAIRGNVAIVAQSGGLGFSIFSRGVAAGVGFSHVISVGNETDLDVLDCAEYLVTQPDVAVIGMYVEGLRHPERLAAVAAAAADAGKAIVIGKAGSSTAGSRATVSHTGHLAGESGVYDAVFRRLGVVQVGDQEELLDVCWALSAGRVHPGNRAAIVSWSGGSAVWTADACERAGFELPVLAADVREELAEVLPPFAGVSNPVDITGAAKTSVGAVMRVVATAPDIDALVLITTLNSVRALERDRDNLRLLMAETTKPIVAYTYTEPLPANRRLFRELGLPLYPSSNRCARALAALRGLAESRAAAAASPAPNADPDDAVVHTEYETTRLLRRHGFPTAPQEIAGTEDDAVRAAVRIGFPVALKLQATGIAHKADAGGLLLNVSGEDEVREGFGKLMEVGRDATGVEGVLVQRMVPDGLELLVGIDNTSGFGPMLMVGLGGGDAERVCDATLECLPVTADDVVAMLGRLRHGALFIKPVGGLPRFATAAVVDFVVRLSDWAVANARHVRELDINPLMVSETGVTVVDSLLVTAGPALIQEGRSS